MAKMLQLGDWEDYKGVGQYVKKKANIVFGQPGGDKSTMKQVAYMKGEPIMNGDGKLVTWAYYVKGPAVPKGKPIFFQSPRAAMKWLKDNSQYKEFDADSAYEKAEDYTPVLGGTVESAFTAALQIAQQSTIDGGETSS